MSPAIAEDKKWQIESDARTIMEAEKIKMDEKRLNACMTFIKQEQEAREKLLKAAYGRGK